LAPSWAARFAMARPIPRLAPEMNMVFAFSDMCVTVTLLTIASDPRSGNTVAIIAVEAGKADSVSPSL